MPENTTDDEPTDENANPKRSVIEEIRHRQADDEEESEGSEGSGSKLRTLLFLGFAFIAGYLVGKSRSESDFRDELGEFSGAEGGPMEIEIHDTDSVTESDEDDEAEDTDEAAEADETESDESADEAEGDEKEGGEEEERKRKKRRGRITQ